VRVVAIVGRPNVGKSTLFNRLVPGRTAVVDDTPGTTRDRHYGLVEHARRTFLLVDTGGFEPTTADKLKSAVRAQTELAVEEADVIVYLGDGREGLLPEDHAVIDRLRRSGKPVVWAVNKIDNDKMEADAYVFTETGIGPLAFLSTAHGRGIDGLCDAIVALLPPPDARELEVARAAALAAAEDEEEAFPGAEDDEPAAAEEDEAAGEGADGEPAPGGDETDGAGRARAPGAAPAADAPIRVAIVGRPNVGKSSLVNRFLGENRHLVTDIPGTTVDAIDSEVTVGGRRFVLVDTAGVRRKRSISATLEKVAVVRTFRAVESADVVVLLLDAVEGPSDQDARLAGIAVDAGRALVFALNRWDLMPPGEEAARAAITKVRDAFQFAAYAPIVRCSALTGKAVAGVLERAATVHVEFNRRVSTAALNRAFGEITARHAPPSAGNRRVRLYYATQVAVGPPTFVVSANYPKDVHFSYRRYVQNQLRERFGFEGTPLRVFYRPHRERDAAPTRPARARGRSQRR